MNESIKIKDPSPLVQSVLALDDHFTQMERLSQKIDETKLKSDFDFEQVRKLMGHFAEHSKRVSREISQLSNHIQKSRVRAEVAMKMVSAKAELLQSRKNAEDKELQAFRDLAQKVAALNQTIRDLMKPAGEASSGEERLVIINQLLALEFQLEPLIEEAQALQMTAHESKMKGLEHDAEALTQTLINVRQKLSSFRKPAQLH